MADSNQLIEDDENDDRTTVIDREAPDLDERTVVVDRSADPDDGTVVVDRSAAPDDGTVVIDRGSDVDDGTVVVDRGTAADDGTSVVQRGKNREARRASVLDSVPSGRGRRSITVPPVEPGFGRDAVEAVGPGAVSSYEPRAIPAAPLSPGDIPLGEEATRADAPSMPSVSRRSRRLGLAALASFAAACVVSVVGLIVAAVSIFG